MMRSQPALFRWYRNRFLTTGERCEISVQLTGPGQQVTLMPGVSSLQPNPFSNIRKPPIMKHTPIIATLVLLFSLLSGFSHAQEAAININTADVSTLASLQGIGEGKAQAIVEYREANGPFASTADLAQVKGIGERTVEKNAERLTVE
jgi:competence protein ComEA|tara:strand:+ start:155 stop:598 length:444 start_codon:yes stop_codon:yes gene_type:complete